MDLQNAKILPNAIIRANMDVKRNAGVQNLSSSQSIQSGTLNVRGQYMFLNDTYTGKDAKQGGIVFNTKIIQAPACSDTSIVSTTVTLTNLVSSAAPSIDAVTTITGFAADDERQHMIVGSATNVSWQANGGVGGQPLATSSFLRGL